MDMTPGWFGLLLMILVLLALWRLGRRGGRRATAIAVCALVLAVSGLFFVRTVRVAERPHVVQGPSGPFVYEAPRAVSDLSTEVASPRAVRHLDRSSTDDLDPDVFPSERSAIVAGARALLRDLGSVVPDGVELKEVSVSGVADDRTRTDIQAAILKHVPAARVTFDGVAEAQPLEASQAALRIEGASHPSTPGDVHHQWFSRELTLIGAGGQLSRAVQVMTKSWVEDPQGYQNHEGGRWLVADPGTLASTQKQALDAARRAAADQIEPLVRARAVRQPDLHPSLIDSARGRGLIEVELAHGAIRDSFVQTFERQAGKVYRAALLLDVSEPQMERLTREYAASFSARQTRLRSGLLSGAGLILVILLVYVFLNAATKGYYVWSLRIACTVLLVTGVLAMVVLI